LVHLQLQPWEDLLAGEQLDDLVGQPFLIFLFSFSFLFFLFFILFAGVFLELGLFVLCFAGYCTSQQDTPLLGTDTSTDTAGGALVWFGRF
jgi:hypothetical protein